MSCLRLLAMLLPIAALFTGCISTDITSIGATIQSSILLESVEDFHLATDGSGAPYAIVRSHPDGRSGHLVELLSDSWHPDGDSLRYIYHSREARGLVAGATAVKNGSLSFAQPLIATSMITYHEYTDWTSGRSVLLVLSDGDDYRLVRLRY